MKDQDFANYQRILSGYPPLSFTLLGFHLTVTIAGLAGMFALIRSSMEPQLIAFWVSALSFLAAFVTLMLWLMWFREHALKDKAVEELQDAGIQSPVTRKWTGVVTAMHTAFYLFGFILWVSLACASGSNSPWLLVKFGL